ncbi:MAG: hypothetical protein AAB662_01985 [Patescibacteria group bacterium]
MEPPVEPQKASNLEPSENKISPIVIVRNGERAVSVQIADINSLFRDIESYNRQFSLGSQMSSLISGAFDKRGKKESSEDSEEIFSGISDEQQHMSVLRLSVVHGDLLKNIGLSFDPVSGKEGIALFKGKRAESGEMRLSIDNRGQFTAFLKGLASEQVSKTLLEENLTSLTNVLNKQILDNYDLKEPDDETLSFLGSLGTIVAEYKRLGLVVEAEKLEEYLIHSREGNLREFVEIRASGLMQKPGEGFGPADWVKDSGPKFLTRKWDEALAVLRNASKNPKAHGLHKELLAHLNECVIIAQKNLEGIKYYTSENKAKLKEILAKAADELSGFET